MCSFKDGCRNADQFWVMTHRVGKTTCGCGYQPNMMCCVVHLKATVKRVSELNQSITTGDYNATGVIVKTRESRGSEWSVWILVLQGIGLAVDFNVNCPRKGIPVRGETVWSPSRSTRTLNSSSKVM
jgi:hypothetical protein